MTGTNIRTILAGKNVVGAFADVAAAQAAVRMLEQRGFTPDRVGIVRGDARDARELAGSDSPQGAIVGGVIGVLLVAASVVLGPAWMRDPVAIALGGVAIVVGLTGIGWLAGRARIFKAAESDVLEGEIEAGETLVSVVTDTPDGVDVARATLERAGAVDVRIEDTAEGV